MKFKLRNSKIPYRDPRVKLGDDTVGNFEFLEIAPSALLLRNDGIFKFSVMSSPRGLGDDRKRYPQKGILVEFKLRNSKILRNSS